MVSIVQLVSSLSTCEVSNPINLSSYVVQEEPDLFRKHKLIPPSILFLYFYIQSNSALVYITQLFSLYRLNWWPAALGAKTSYAAFWLLSLCAGYALHVLDPLGSENKSLDNGGGEADDIQWQRKTLWVGLAFATMAMPALVCLAGLRRSGRQNYRHSLTEAQKSEF